MKLLIVATFLVVVGFATATNSTWGFVGPYDRILHREIIKKSSSWLQKATKDIRYPSPYVTNNRTITAIKVLDRVPNGKGGTAEIYVGGVGFNYTIIHFKSQRSEKLDFELEIYSRY